ncbi:SLC13 family permease [Natronococcus sp. A-GB7]|uniref:GntP family permease n=1 Tax=Natronococcus sp. A-GB7 TaxID=3037649 RepID=UPI0024200036|nr:SLC13 family permease [Natronococcus sp. A-GB7]MDG5821252.1 SLC13 family permease [Natronococcus sp. A-GB7]
MVLSNPLIPFVIGLVIAVVLLVWVKLPAFVGLIIAAMAIGVVTPQIAFDAVPAQVAESFGDVMVSIGIPILMAAIIGKTLMDSGAAERIVRAFRSLTGEDQSEWALMGSSYVLSIPVFFDNVFFLLAPLGRSMKARTGVKFSLYISVLCAGALATHMLVPPTPGPLAMSAELDVDVGLALLVGVGLALPTSLLGGIVYGRFLHSREDFPLREAMGSSPESLKEKAETPVDQLPGLFESSLPIAVPVVFIASATITDALLGDGSFVADLAAFLGDPNFALTAAAMLSAFTFFRMEMDGDRSLFSDELTESIKSGGNIIAITAAGGTFGAMLEIAGVGQYIADGLVDFGLPLLFAGWLVAAVIRVAQGSGTVAILTGAAMMAPLTGDLTAHPVYMMMAVGFGGMIAPWYNDSGFWTVSKIAGITQAETFKTYSVVATIMSVSGLILVLAASVVMPLT